MNICVPNCSSTCHVFGNWNLGFRIFDVKPVKVIMLVNSRTKVKYWVVITNNPQLQPVGAEEKRFDSTDFLYSIFGREHFGLRPVDLPEAASWTPHLQGKYIYILFFIMVRFCSF